MEFQLTPSGKLRRTNNSNGKSSSMIRKEIFLRLQLKMKPNASLNKGKLQNQTCSASTKNELSCPRVRGSPEKRKINNVE